MILYAAAALIGVGAVIAGVRFVLNAMTSLGNSEVEIDERDYLSWQEKELERLRMEYAVAEELPGTDPQTLEALRLQFVAMEQNIAKTRAQLLAQPVVADEPVPVHQPVGIPIPTYAFLDKKDLNAGRK